MAADDDLFTPPGTAWTRIQPRLALQRRISILVTNVVLLGGLLIGYLLTGGAVWWGLAATLVVIGAVVEFVVVGRWVANFGYAERDEDLWITSGAMLRRLTVVPYGRMQLVDVTQGLFERMFGLATVQMHTAASGTDAEIPGLLPEEASRLRDRLTELGASELSGL